MRSATKTDAAFCRRRFYSPNREAVIRRHAHKTKLGQAPLSPEFVGPQSPVGQVSDLPRLLPRSCRRANARCFRPANARVFGPKLGSNAELRWHWALSPVRYHVQSGAHRGIFYFLRERTQAAGQDSLWTDSRPALDALQPVNEPQYAKYFLFCKNEPRRGPGTLPLNRKPVQLTVAVSDEFRTHTRLIEHRHIKIRHRRTLRIHDVSPRRHAAITAPRQHHRQILMGMRIAIADRARIDKERVVQQRAIAVLRGLQLLK